LPRPHVKSAKTPNQQFLNWDFFGEIENILITENLTVGGIRIRKDNLTIFPIINRPNADALTDF
jgi:hypothetical protein